MKLKNGTVLEVGKKYIHATWLKDEVYEVTAIGRYLFTYIPKGCDYELTHEIDNDWIPYEEKKKSLESEVILEGNNSIHITGLASLANLTDKCLKITIKELTR